MSFERPSLRRLISRAQQDVEAYLQNGSAFLKRSLEYVFARTVAGLTHGLHGHLAYLARQVVPSEQSAEEFLVRWARFFGVDRKTATAAQFSVLFSGTASSSIPAGTQIAREDGTVFETDALATIPASAPLEVSVDVTAVEAGADGNTEVGTTLSLVSPVAGIDADATVEGTPSETVGSGTDQETLPNLLQRLLDRVQTPPSGGGPGDWADWAKEVDGVTRAWEMPQQLGPGTVLVLFVLDTFNEDGTFAATTFPGASEIADVQAKLDAEAPVVSTPTAQAPVEVTLDPQIRISPDTTAVREAIEAQLNDLLLRKAEPGGTLLLSQIREAISLASGEQDHVLDSPAADVTVDTDELLTLGTPVFSAL